MFSPVLSYIVPLAAIVGLICAAVILPALKS